MLALPCRFSSNCIYNLTTSPFLYPIAQSGPPSAVTWVTATAYLLVSRFQPRPCSVCCPQSSFRELPEMYTRYATPLLLCSESPDGSPRLSTTCPCDLSDLNPYSPPPSSLPTSDTGLLAQVHRPLPGMLSPCILCDWVPAFFRGSPRVSLFSARLSLTILHKIPVQPPNCRPLTRHIPLQTYFFPSAHHHLTENTVYLLFVYLCHQGSNLCVSVPCQILRPPTVPDTEQAYEPVINISSETPCL